MISLKYIVVLGLLMAYQYNIIAFVLKSNDFKGHDAIPEKFTCDGENISPHLMWQDIPNGTQSLVLTLEDPDAPGDEPFVHWIMYNIPAQQTELKQNIPPNSLLENGAYQSYNDFNEIGYGGPCPPKGHGVHNYYFTLYALNKKLDFDGDVDKEQIINSLEKHSIGKAVLIGLYERN